MMYKRSLSKINGFYLFQCYFYWRLDIGKMEDLLLYKQRLIVP